MCRLVGGAQKNKNKNTGDDGRMERKQIEHYYQKKVRLILKNQDIYTGKVTSISENSLTILDKFNEHVTISFDSIFLLREHFQRGWQ